MRNIALALFAWVLCSAAVASADSVSKLDIYKGAPGTDINAATCAAVRYTGWVNVNVYRSITWSIYFNGDGAPATTAVTMSCQTSDDKTTANGSGDDLHTLIPSSTTLGTSNSYVHTWSNAVTADERWTWSVANLPQNYINCAFTCVSGDADDAITVTHKVVTP